MVCDVEYCRDTANLMMNVYPDMKFSDSVGGLK